jgi:hypothetical protein
MEEISNAAYPPETTHQTAPQETMTDDQLKDLLAQLISSSASLNVRVWLDGVYTDIENAAARREWMKGREVYFKVEGKVDSQNSLEEASPRGV